MAESSWFEDVLAFFGTVITGVVDVITTVVDFFIEIVESVFGWIVSALAFIVELFFMIPVLGRILKWIWNIVLTVVSVIVGLPDFLVGLIGILPEKKLRICVVILRDEMGEELTDPGSVVPLLQNAIDIFRREANVRIIPSAPFQFDSAFADRERATEDWVHTQTRGSNDSSLIDVDCDLGATGEDLLRVGTSFESLASTECFYSNARRVLGIGAPVVVFIVRNVAGKDQSGCSLGPLSDYVTVEANRPPDSDIIAHELGHACNLCHVDDRNNLMALGRTDNRLTRFQVAWLRQSRHVAYF